ncbi:type II toxin-antitoxin system VapC family toxin [Sphingomonas sp. M1-B02]|uniref:type II toxin-antitoxin system VapC family toxin n=1 Tax=Sphingomonas sp. M1-B02 TaxID=3114300 RepID=UPI00223F12CE|nr:type II toxin-antitoxin system VapC family toxin [Sphingomonas sp. S6-11]UZK67401.1 type II toxin-antitoxin system VapC family toxin [Sphingomonas sp. S6-11]
MILDSSVLVAILQEEPEAATLIEALADHWGAIRLSAANYLEATIVIDRNGSAELSARFDALIKAFAVEIVPVTKEQAEIGRQAYCAYGKGNHPARLNFGDCFAYALAKATNEPLLFKGGDFAQTDIAAA